ncbi:hypothetical protein Z949_3197 [Sulfitobacter guttiformis KCTC 32187]|nr:hypothetical protein Z949_3197 [Sulfitobacter guttiformis KCTC 32187]
MLDRSANHAYSTQVWTAKRFRTAVLSQQRPSKDDATSGGLCADPTEQTEALGSL